MFQPFFLYASSSERRSPASANTPPKPGPVSYEKASGGSSDCSLVFISVRTSSGGTASRSRVYFGYCSWKRSTLISIFALSWLVVSAVPVKYLTTLPLLWLPPQPALPSKAAPASPTPPSFRKSLRLTALIVLGILYSFPRCHTFPTPAFCMRSPYPTDGVRSPPSAASTLAPVTPAVPSSSLKTTGKVRVASGSERR